MHNRLRAFHRLAVLLFFAVGLAAPAVAADQPAPKVDRESIERIVRDYLLRNPEIIEEAVRILRAKRAAEEERLAREAITAQKGALYGNPMTPVSGNPDGDVTIVEFFDYQCGYCKRSLGMITELLNSDRKIRVVWKEFPILGPVSRLAATAGMAARKQGKYFDYHVAIMGARGRLTEKRIFGLAGKAGLNVERLKSDMKDPKISAYLDETIRLASTLGIRGTPAFIIGGKLLPGAVDAATMKQLIARYRADG